MTQLTCRISPPFIKMLTQGWSCIYKASRLFTDTSVTEAESDWWLSGVGARGGGQTAQWALGVYLGGAGEDGLVWGGS